VLNETGYLEALAAERTVEAEGRAENLEALVAGGAEFDIERQREGESEVPPLEEYLQQISLYTEQDALEGASEELVTLMTLHNAKGSSTTLSSSSAARTAPSPTCGRRRGGRRGGAAALLRRHHPRRTPPLHDLGARAAAVRPRRAQHASRFIDELPAELTERHGSSPAGLTSWGSTIPGTGPAESDRPRPGARAADRDDVVHASFGDGVVTGVEPGGVVVVRFSGDGSSSFAPAQQSCRGASGQCGGRPGGPAEAA